MIFFSDRPLNLHGWKETWQCSEAESDGTRESELHSWAHLSHVHLKNDEKLAPLSFSTPAENIPHFPSALPVPSSHLSLTSSALCPLKGLRTVLCGEAWPDRPREALQLRLLSRPRFLSPPSRLTRRRSRQPVGGGWLSSSPSSCRTVIWGKSWLSVRWEC